MKYGELSHFSHPQHKLRLEYSELPFKCDGCKEAGIGSRFRCALCDFDLHKHCAVANSSLLRHPFYPKCAFAFLPRPPGDAPRVCDACGRDVAGFVLHCRSCGFDLHPCCAALPHVIVAGGGRDQLSLFLHRKSGSACHRCGRKGRSWSYRTACKKYSLHVACVMEMLEDSWHEIYAGGGGGGGGSAHGKRGPTAIPGGGGYVSNINRIPSIRGVGRNHHRRKGKVRRCCELAAMTIQFIISAVLGDPTAIIAGVVGALISR